MWPLFVRRSTSACKRCKTLPSWQYPVCNFRKSQFDCFFIPYQSRATSTTSVWLVTGSLPLPVALEQNALANVISYWSCWKTAYHLVPYLCKPTLFVKSNMLGVDRQILRGMRGILRFSFDHPRRVIPIAINNADYTLRILPRAASGSEPKTID